MSNPCIEPETERTRRGKAVPARALLPFPFLAAGFAASVILLVQSCVFDRSGLTKECGNGVVNGTEECDGADLGGTDCVSLGFGSGVLGCRDDCTFDTDGCGIVQCNNGVKESSEECDGTDLGGQSCEGLGFAGGTLICGPLCRLDTTACLDTCPNGVVDGDEDCEGADLAGQTCLSQGYQGGQLSCNDDCTFDFTDCISVDCGNNLAESNEVCDGSDLRGESCESQDYAGGVLSCQDNCQAFDYFDCLRKDGGDCTQDSQCVGGNCLTESEDGLPGGYCTSGCWDFQCDDGGYCGWVDYDRVCFKRCSVPSSECRPGYACYDRDSTGHTYCAPACSQASDCPETGTCNPFTLRCEAVETDRNDNGAACYYAGNCKSGICWDNNVLGHDWTDGYCTSRCILSDPHCPDDGVCTDVFSGARGDEGRCLDGCVVNQDQCRTGYDCQTNPWGSGTVCLPTAPQ